VKTFKVSEGTTKINWNGRDAKGNACGSGIYFYKLSTPSMNQTKKMVIVK
jgi:flagellar hook assembly protein FlgD